jgi:predicted DNA-binding WGR domain protein
MSKRYFEFSEGTSNKFWEIWVEGVEVHTRYGKIGTEGQRTLKDEGAAERAQKLYDKLIREKTGKGYQEKTAGGAAAAPAAKAAPAEKPAKAGDFKAAWKALETAKDLPAALEAHLGFLCDTDGCKKVLKKLCAAATSAKAGEQLTVIFTSPEGTEYEGDEWTMEASPPYTGKFDAMVPKTHRRFAEHHNGMSLEGSDVPLGFAGVSDDGKLTGSSFEDEWLEESEPEIYEKFQDKDLPILDPIGHHQDFVLYNFLKKTKLGEPALQYISHEGGGLDAPYDLSLGITGVFLRLMAADVLGDSKLIKQEGGGGGEEDDDEGDDDSEGGGSEGARRFEFSEDGSNKFWEISVDGASHTVRYGKIGTDGQSKTKEFDDDEAAAADAAKLIKEKTKKGYAEIE